MSTDHIPEVRQMVPAVGARPEPGVRPAEPERAAFERWVTDDGKWPQAALRTVGGGYSLMIAHTQWTAWRAGSLAERERWIALCEQALDALEYHREQTRPIDRTTAAIAALRAGLGQCVHGGPNRD